MPSAHRRYRDWTHERIRHEAQAEQAVHHIVLEDYIATVELRSALTV
jgi:hypothetical protein